MKNKLGVMQGRLLPKYKDRYQAHPVGFWMEEFSIAASMGLDLIEFIVDYELVDINPLFTIEGRKKIKNLSKKTGVKVQTVCADYLMEAPLHSKNRTAAKKSYQTLTSLISIASEMQIKDIVIPCVDRASLKLPEEIDRLLNQLNALIPSAEKEKVNLSLETDLPPKPFADLLNRLPSKRLTVNYDIGNSASLGYDPVEELEAYGKYITDVHIKDRNLRGGSVVLGKGRADFDLFFNKLADFNYCGPFILQAYRDDEGLIIFKKQLSWIKPYLENFFSKSVSNYHRKV